MNTKDPREILLIDLESDERRAVAEMIRKAGYAVRETADVAAALVGIAAGEAALVVCDLDLGDRSGWDVLEAAKKCAPDVPFVLMTARVSVHGEDLLTTRRGDGYILKPPDPQRLGFLLKALLSPTGIGREADVLVADRDARTRDLVEQALNAAGAFVRKTDSPGAAWRILRDESPDVLIVEGTAAGFDLCRKVRYSALTRFMPILLICSMPTREDVRQAVRLRVNGIVVRPFKPSALVARVTALLKLNAKH